MGTVNLELLGKVLFLLTIANGTPVIGKKILGDKMAFPIDGRLILGDGQPLFGKSKTIRGVAWLSSSRRCWLHWSIWSS